jgi:hypothetical protein
MDCPSGTVAIAAVQEPFNRIRENVVGEATLYYQIADCLTANFSGCSTSAHDLSMAGVAREHHANDIAAPADEFKAVGGPRKVGPDRDDLAIVKPPLRFPGVRVAGRNTVTGGHLGDPGLRLPCAILL